MPLTRNACKFIVAQFGSRFANSFLTTAVRFEILEAGGVVKFASAQVANQVARVFMQQIAGVLTDNQPLKHLYVIGEAFNLILVVALMPVLMGIGAAESLFFVNVGLGLTQAFSQPVSKSMPPLIVQPEDFAIVNSWDLTGDKIGRNLAPMALTILSSSFGFRVAAGSSLAMYVALVALKMSVEISETKKKTMASDATKASVFSRLLRVFTQVKDGLLSLRNDRTIGLLILNTLITNMLLYPLGSVVFPVIFRAIPEGSIELEGSIASSFILALQQIVGVQKKKARV